MRLVLDARTASFAALIDYAGLFPPASLDIDGAVAGYRAARSSGDRWIAGRFLCPTSRLSDLAGSLTKSFTAGEQPWEVGAIFDQESGASAAEAQAFHAEMEPAAVIASAEGKPRDGDLGRLVDTMTSIQPELVPFIEIDRARDIPSQIAETARSLHDRGRVGGVKLRCGGLTHDLFPTPEEVATFIAGANAHGVPFKATAGLHQPVRHHDARLGVWRHGFLNVLVAAAAAESGADLTTLTEIIAEVDPAAFTIGSAFATWRDLSFPGSALRRVRASGFVAYGSCDFDEPVAALRELDFIGEGV